MKALLIGIIILLFVSAGTLLFFVFAPSKQTQTAETQNVKTAETNGTTITVTDEKSFSPKVLTVNVGTTVMWVNKTGGPISVDSDPHPIHTDYPPLNLGNIDDGKTASLSFPKPGTYNYHDHYHPYRTGTIIVK